jgi:uncharacterized membrane protein YheB (UPF0754 family)
MPDFQMIWLSIPVISATIGWFTNYVAVKMLLHPVEPIRFLGLTIQGVIPKRHNDLAEKIAEAITADFLTEEDLAKLIGSVDMKPMLESLIRRKWDEKIDDILGAMPMIQMFLPPDKLEDIRERLIVAFTEDSEQAAEAIAQSLTGQIDLSAIIHKNVMDFDLAKIEAIVEKIAEKEFRFVERLGGLIGFVIGVLQILLLWLMPR